jgi:2-polyprenyl-3-methyl-5-hydroxy-6-metoxy-1,4-benzoquinol methylase
MTVSADRNRSGVAEEILSVLRCLSCRGHLQDRGSELVCTSCGREYPQINGVTRFVTAENYADSFGFQWQRYARTQLDDAASGQSNKDFPRKTGLTPEDLKGKLVLDVGCGMGRFADVATRWGAKVVGVDLSAAAEVAARNLADREFVALQADVFALPFAPESFDYIYSIGVLHHTPNCEQAVKALPQYLKPGGTLAVWLYSAYNKWYRFSDVYRRFTHRLPAKTLHGMLRVVVPTVNAVDSVLRVVPGIGRPLSGFVRHVFPVNRNPNRQWRVLDTFDWYSPQYQSKHTYEEVFRWFESCGMEDLHVADVPISVYGRKPLL